MRPDAMRSILTQGLFAVVLVGAVIGGGGQGGVIDHALVLPALVLIGLTLQERHRGQAATVPAHLLYGLPALVLLLPVLQLLPLPGHLWQQLPGRAPIGEALQQVGLMPALASGSIAPVRTEQVLWGLMIPIAVYVAALHMSHATQRRWLSVLLVLAVLNVLLGLAQIQGGGQDGLYWYDVTNVGVAVGTFANRNHLASELVMLVPVVMALLLELREESPAGAWRLQGWWLVLVMIFLAVGVTLTQSRAGFALLMAAIVACAVLVAVRTRRRRLERNPWLPLGLVITGVLVLQYTLYAILLRLSVDPLDDLRWLFARQALHVASLSGGVGWGLGSFVHAYDLIGDASAAQPFFVNHVHNDYLELWLEGGVLAVLLIALALVALALRSVRVIRDLNALHGKRPYLPVAAALSLWLVLAHSVVDYPLRTSTIEALAALLLAVLLRTPADPVAQVPPEAARKDSRPAGVTRSPLYAIASRKISP